MSERIGPTNRALVRSLGIPSSRALRLRRGKDERQARRRPTSCARVDRRPRKRNVDEHSTTHNDGAGSNTVGGAF